MITPKFGLSQDENHLIVHIRLPYVKITNSQFYIEKNTFKFYLKPYLLTLNFAQSLKEEDEPADLKYDHNTYVLTCKLSKLIHGEKFENLDMITNFVGKIKDQKPQKKKNKPLIQVLSSSEEQNDEIEENKKNIEYPKDKYKYGFNDQYIGFFDDLHEELLEMSGLNPDDSSKEERIVLQQEILRADFNAAHYLFDLYDNEDLEKIIETEIPFYEKDFKNIEDPLMVYDENEWKTLKKLKNKEFLIDDPKIVLLEMIDILFSFCYEYRTMEGELTCESPATINRLSSVFHCFVVHNSLEGVLNTCFSKCLVYPFIRNFELCLKVKDDVCKILKRGKILLLKIFLKLRNSFEKNEPRYLLNTLYVDDYCLYLQKMDEKTLSELSDQIKHVIIEKRMLDLNIEEVENKAMEDLANEMEEKL